MVVYIEVISDCLGVFCEMLISDLWPVVDFSRLIQGND
jgi:hypothetical protein